MNLTVPILVTLLGPLVVGLVPGVVAMFRGRSLIFWWLTSGVSMAIGLQAGIVLVPSSFPGVSPGDGGAYAALGVCTLFLAVLLIAPKSSKEKS